MSPHCSAAHVLESDLRAQHLSLEVTRTHENAYGIVYEIAGPIKATEHGLRAGDVGTVVERHAVAGVSEDGYSVEFFDMTGNTVAVITLPAGALRMPTQTDRPAVRALSA